MESAESARPQPEHAPEGQHAEPRRYRIARIYNRVLIFLFVYVFSTGPLYWACYEGLRDAASADSLLELPAIGILYYPIAWACQIPAIGRWFDWYVNLWL